jgi:hypothetical protein
MDAGRAFPAIGVGFTPKMPALRIAKGYQYAHIGSRQRRPENHQRSAAIVPHRSHADYQLDELTVDVLAEHSRLCKQAVLAGKTVKEISELYEKHVPTVMEKKTPGDKSQALAELAQAVFKEDKFDKMKTGVGIVTTKWVIERPMIFKTSIDQAHGRMGTFAPGFGVKVSDPVQASCSAYPFFNRKTVKTEQGDLIELIDGGYRRSDALEKRRKLMEAWGAYCEPKARSNVVQRRA